MAVTLHDGIRFRIARDPLGFSVRAARKNADGTVDDITFPLDIDAIAGLRTFRSARIIVLAHLRAFGGKAVFKTVAFPS